MPLAIGDTIAAATIKRLRTSIAHSADGLPRKAKKVCFNIIPPIGFQAVTSCRRHAGSRYAAAGTGAVTPVTYSKDDLVRLISTRTPAEWPAAIASVRAPPQADTKTPWGSQSRAGARRSQAERPPRGVRIARRRALLSRVEDERGDCGYPMTSAALSCARLSLVRP